MSQQKTRFWHNPRFGIVFVIAIFAVLFGPGLYRNYEASQIEAQRVENLQNRYDHWFNDSFKVETVLRDVKDYEQSVRHDEQKFRDQDGKVIPPHRWDAADQMQLSLLKTALQSSKARFNRFAAEYNEKMEANNFPFTTLESLPPDRKDVLPRRYEFLPTH